MSSKDPVIDLEALDNIEESLEGENEVDKKEIGKLCLSKVRDILNNIDEERINELSGKDMAYLVKVLTEQGLTLSGQASRITKTEKVEESKVDEYLKRYEKSTKERSTKKTLSN